MVNREKPGGGDQHFGEGFGGGGGAGHTADSLDASSLKSSKELVSSNMKGKLDSIRNLLQK